MRHGRVLRDRQMNEITVVFTVHTESISIRSQDLVKILESLQPEMMIIKLIS